MASDIGHQPLPVPPTLSNTPTPLSMRPPCPHYHSLLVHLRMQPAHSVRRPLRLVHQRQVLHQQLVRLLLATLGVGAEATDLAPQVLDLRHLALQGVDLGRQLREADGETQR